jgi:tetratricopeptide (TPR) repeat protein
MKRLFLFVLCLSLSGFVLAQQKSAPPPNQAPPANPNPPNATTPAAPGQASSSNPSSSAQPDSDDDNNAQESSSHDTRTDIAPPPDDAKAHPDSKSAVEDLTPTPPPASDVQEFHPWNPMKASKDIQVGDFYYKRGNYKAALDRYKEALYYKENDAVATYRLAVCQEKLGDKDEARKNFEQYLKILPEGPYAKEARASLGKLGKKQSTNN